jgi:hypothetical protein
VTNAASYNVASISRSGAGLFTVNFTTNFASTAYACEISASGGSGNTFLPNVVSRSVGSLSIEIGQATSFARTDPTDFSIACQGSQ